MSHAVASDQQIGSILSSRRISVPLAVVQIAGVGMASFLLGLPVWVALVGWAVYYSRGSTLRDGGYNLACAVTGLGLGVVALSAAAAKFGASAGLVALSSALLLAAASVHLMQFVTGVNNIPSYAIGVLIVFAANMDSSLDTYMTLTAAVSVGAFTAALADLIRREPEVEQ